MAEEPVADIGLAPYGGAPRRGRRPQRKPHSITWPKGTLLTAFGKSQTIAQWSAETGISYGLIWHRVTRAGWTQEDAISIPPRHHLIAANDETLSLSEWARRLGCDPAVIRGRLKNGWPVEDAVSSPVRFKACVANDNDRQRAG